MDQSEQSIMGLIATLSMTTGGMSMVFLIYCVDQLTQLKNFRLPSESETAKFSVCKYLMALIVVAISSTIFLVIGFFIIMNFQEPNIWSNIKTIIYPLFYYAVSCLVFMILLITIFEYIEHREGLP